MGLKPTVYHMNEGHSAFLALEQIRLFMRDEELSFEEALEPAAPATSSPPTRPFRRGSTCSTPGLMYYYFSEYCGESRHRFPAVDGARPAQSCQTATSASPWPCWP